MTLADRIGAALDAAAIPHALIGAAALAAAGVARSTFDLDLLTTDSRALDEQMWRSVREAGTDVELRRGDDDDPLAGVIRTSAPGERSVDVIVGRFAWQRRAVERACLMPGGRRVVLARDLVLLKLFAGGVQDLWDLRQLLAVVPAGSLDGVDEDLQQLPASAAKLWAEVRGQKP